MLCQQVRSRFARPSPSSRLRVPRLKKLACNSSLESKEQTGTSGEVQSIWLPTGSLFQSVGIEVMPFGPGEVIAVTDVEEGSVAEKAGLAPGQAIVGISDAIRDDQIWPITSRPSMRFVKQVLKMRMRGQVQLQIQWHEELQKQIEAAAGAAASPPPMPQQQQQQQQQQGATDASVSAMTSLDTMLGGDTPSSGGNGNMSSAEGTTTVGEVMAKKYEAAQATKAETKGMSDVRQRKQRRAEYLGEVGKRNDAPLLLGLLLAFVGPALIILAIAFSTGYIDNLVESSITIR